MTDLPRAVLCTPIDVDRRAVLELLAGHEFTDHEIGGVVYRETEYEGLHGSWRLVLAMTGRGNERAAASIEHALATWRPQILVLCGIAGGLRDARIGDVVVATKVYGYEDTDGGTLPRLDAISGSFPLLQRAQLLAEDPQWAKGFEAVPRVLHRPIASALKVVTGDHSATAAHIERYSGDAQAVETEGYGAMAAALRRPAVEAIVVRGISDVLGDKTKEADKRHWPIAARNAAAFALALIGRSKPKPVEIRTFGQGAGNTYIGAIGQGAGASVGAMGDNARGHIVFERTGSGFQPAEPLDQDPPDIDDNSRPAG